jgi:hypothetical protein
MKYVIEEIYEKLIDTSQFRLTSDILHERLRISLRVYRA